MVKNSGTRSIVDQSENSWSTGNDRPVATKKIGTKNPKPMPSSLWRTCPNSSSRAGSVTAESERAGEERTQDGVEAQPFAHDEQRDHQQHRDPHAQLRAAVLQSEQHLIDPLPPRALARPEVRDGDDEQREHAEVHDREHDPVVPLGEKNIDSTTIEPNSATEHAATTKVPACVSRIPASFNTGHHDAERRRRQDDRQQQRVDDHLGAAEWEREREADRQRRDEADQPELERAPAQLAEVELEPGEEQEQRHAEL